MQFAVILLAGTAFVHFFGNFAAAKSTAVVNTTSGPVRGQILDTVNAVKYAAFKGIRYAKAPLGYLRFKPPVAVYPWTETLNATVEGNDCPQIDTISSKSGEVTGSEDCLFVNVFTPMTNLEKTPKTLRSVMVWFHGGGFKIGSSSSERYHPDYILERNVVYVSLNYRLGPLGFLNLGHCNATGNAGLKDQVLGLKWVQANIEKFGGNPKNVTIFGQSTGAASVGFHVISEASAGLFHGSIGMSGVPLNTGRIVTPVQALSQAVKLGALIGINSTDKVTLVKAFYDAPAAKLIEAAAPLTAISPPFGPTIEDKSISTDVFLSECSLVKYFTGNFTKVPQVLGYMDQETLLSARGWIEQLIANSNDSSTIVPESIITELKNLLTNSSSEQLTGTALQAAINITTDTFVAQIDQTQRLLAANNDDKPVYYYHVSFNNTKPLHSMLFNSTVLGAAHSDDLAYIFYFPLLNYSTDPTDPVTRTIDRVSTMWTNFAKYGNPTPNWVKNNNLNVTWPNSGFSGIMLDIGTQLTVEPRRISREMELMELFSWPRLGEANGCVRENDQF